jgi:3-oxoacyl-[acyl-carrier protein] reductase
MAEKRVAQIAGHLFPKGMLSGQVAIITGSGQGIGAEAAQLFAKEGAKVVVQDIDAGETLESWTAQMVWYLRAD